MTRLTLTTEGDHHLVVIRRFSAPPERLYRAHLDCELIQQWMLGPEGWSMPRCSCDARPGGTFRYEWVGDDGNGFHITGEFLELEPFRRILHVERMHMPNPTPENRIETTFESDGEGGTVLTARMNLPDADTRAAMLESGMEEGMEASYVRLEELA